MDPFRPRRRLPRRTELIAAFLATCLLSADPAAAQAAGDGVPLQLEVSINGQKLNLIAAFVRMPDGSFHATAAELAELGLKTEAAAGGQLIALESLPGARIGYNEAEQTIDIALGDAARVAKSYDAQAQEAGGPAMTGNGVVVNYSAFAASSFDTEGKSDSFIAFDGASLTLDSRAYSRFGVLSNSGIAGTTTFSKADFLRLETAWTYDHPGTMLTGTAGDFVSGGLSWTRPVRYGGVQVRRNFSTRPDLITMPLPEVSGSAAVPSTVDIYINNVKAYSQDVAAGPWTINNIPAVTGSGEARVVVRDATGRETETTSEFIASSDLLRPGLVDYSVEAGFLREEYGEESFDYDSRPMGSASLRYGLASWLTAEAHAEGSEDLLNGGIGATAALGTFAVATLAASGSRFESREGLQLYGSLDTEIAGLNVSISSQRLFGDYSDLAYAASWEPGLSEADLFEIEPIRALDRVALGFKLPFDAEGGFGLSGLHLVTGEDDESWIASVNYTRPFLWKSSLSLSAFADFGDRDNYGAFLHLSAPLGDWGYGSTGATVDKKGFSVSADLSKPRSSEPGSWGWRAQVREGARSHYQGGLAYSSEFADLEASVSHVEGITQGTAAADGALVLADGSLFATRRVDDAFVVVDAGAEGVEVYHENRKAGRTNKSGKLLVTGLNAYEKNKIEIEAGDLPMDSAFGETVMEVVPGDRAGAKADFGVRRGVASALVTITDAAGQPIKPGTEGVSGAGEAFTVGYDGQAYLTELSDENTLTLRTQNGPCTAQFAYHAGEGAQAFIDAVVCQ